MELFEIAPSPLWPARSPAALFEVEEGWLIEEAIAQRILGIRAGKTWLFDPNAVDDHLLIRARTAQRLIQEKGDANGLAY